MLEGFWPGFWQGVFQLVGLGVIAFGINIVYQRFRARSTARQELVDEIDEFTVSLYRPRKVYQSLLDRTHDPLDGIADAGLREARRQELRHRQYEDLVSAVGRFRSLQVKIVPLYGYHLDLFGHYLAIWRYLKEIRKRMEGRESLYFHHENSESVDAFYRLIDAFRYRVLVQKFAEKPPGLVRPPPEVLAEMRRQGDVIYAEYFGTGEEKSRKESP